MVYTQRLARPSGCSALPEHTGPPPPRVLFVSCLSVAGQGVSVEERTAVGGETALTLAVKAGLTQNVKSLLEHGASPHNTNNKNESPLLLGKSLTLAP